MIRIPGRSFAPFSTVLGLPGTEGLSGIQTEVSPTLDLNRILQSSQVNHIEYFFSVAPGATQVSTLQWRDISDWTNVLVNGIVQTLDDEMPPATNQQFVTAVGLEVAASANYTSAEVMAQGIGSANQLLAEFGAVATSHQTVSPVVRLTPMLLDPGQVNCRLRQVVSAVGPTLVFWIQILSAEPGVMAAYFGA